MRFKLWLTRNIRGYEYDLALWKEENGKDFICRKIDFVWEEYNPGDSLVYGTVPHFKENALKELADSIKEYPEVFGMRPSKDLARLEGQLEEAEKRIKFLENMVYSQMEKWKV